jgi:hypothetical protein
MQKSMSVVLGIVAVAICFIVFPILLTSAHDVQTDQAVRTTTGVVTTTGSDATITLATALFKTRAADVIGVSSSESGDTPTLSAVVNGTQVVIGGLATSATRTLNVTYEYDALTDYTGLSSIVSVSPLIIFIGVLGVVVASAWFAWKAKG